MDLSVIIVTWQNGKEIGPCLRSVFACADGLKIEVFVIDNGSHDSTRNAIQDAVREVKNISVKTIWNDENMGFAAAVNQGMKLSAGDFVLLLNPDTQLISGSLQTMINYLRMRSDIGIAGGKVLNPNGRVQPSVRRFPRSSDQVMILTKLYRFFPKLVSSYFCDGFDYEKEQEVDQVRGAYFWVSRKLINKIGNLDEKSFFCWFEEVDYCFLAKEAGFKVMYVPSSVATHVGGASFNQEPSLQKQRWLNRSMRNYFKKRKKYFAWIIISVLSPFSFALAALTQIFKIKPKNYA
jgi:N-acetylglucosaminyl-diphospho-decaprenol L-rhamnosyltransferase